MALTRRNIGDDEYCCLRRAKLSPATLKQMQEEAECRRGRRIADSQILYAARKLVKRGYLTEAFGKSLCGSNRRVRVYTITAEGIEAIAVFDRFVKEWYLDD